MTRKGYDCRRCGACCGSPSFSETIADYDFGNKVDRKRAEAMPNATKKRVLVAPSPLVMLAEILAGGCGGNVATGTKHDRHGNVVCAALRGAINNGKNPSKCSCSIYEFRPRVCRLFPVGGYLCLVARKEAGVFMTKETK